MSDSNFWNKYFVVYDRLNLLYPYKHTLSRIVELLDLVKGDRILDVGSGTGNLSILISEAGADVVSIDSSEAGLALHRKKYSRARTLVVDLNDGLPFADSSFSKVCCNNVIYTLSLGARQRLFNEFYRVVRPGGIVVVSDIARGFRPLAIYIKHLKQSIGKTGVLKTLIQAISLVVPTVLIFYYNYQIRRNDEFGKFGFIEEEEHTNLFKASGFRSISQNERVYANQAILNCAVK